MKLTSPYNIIRLIFLWILSLHLFVGIAPILILINLFNFKQFLPPQFLFTFSNIPLLSLSVFILPLLPLFVFILPLLPLSVFILPLLPLSVFILPLLLFAFSLHYPFQSLIILIVPIQLASPTKPSLPHFKSD